MKILRHPPLLFWLLALLLSGGTVAGLAAAGSDVDREPLTHERDETLTALAVRDRLAAGVHLAAEGGDPLATWARGTSRLAADLADSHVEGGDADDDPFVAALRHASRTAADLADAADDPDARHTAFAELVFAGDRLAAVAAGLDTGPPAPGPDGELAPVGSFAPGPVDPDLTEPALDQPLSR